MATLLLVLLVGCGGTAGRPTGPDGGIRGVEVSGPLGEEPIVRIAAPLEIASTRAHVPVVGAGEPVEADRLVVLHVDLYDARTGSRVASTREPTDVPLVVKTSDGSLFPALAAALEGTPQGSRVVVALSSQDAFAAGGVPPAGVSPDDPLVAVADVLAVPPTETLPSAAGNEVPLPPDAPRIVSGAGDPSRVVVREDAPRRQEVVVVPVITGTGNPVRNHSLVTVDFLGQDTNDPTPFVDTYLKEPIVVPVGAAGSVPSWDRALVGLPAGSRVMILDPSPPARVPGATVPPGRGTIVWIIDVLGVS